MHRRPNRAREVGEEWFPSSMTMAQTQIKTLDDLVRHVGRYPEGAFVFVRESLGFVTEKHHGPESPAHRQLQEFLSSHEIDWAEVESRFYSGSLPEEVQALIAEVGGLEKMNRHVSGRELCWGLRDFALARWGLLARVVLESWNIRATADFGRIVFGFIDLELMQKQPDDSIQDFDDVFDFEQAFDEAYRLSLRASKHESPASEDS